MKALSKKLFYMVGASLLLTLPATTGAYEVNFLTGVGAESQALERGDYAKAIKRLEYRVENRNKNLDVNLTNLCTAYVVTREYEKAFEICDRAVDKGGNFVSVAYNSRGVLHARTGDFVSAIADFAAAESAVAEYRETMAGYCSTCALPDPHWIPDPEVEMMARIAANNSVQADAMWATVQSRMQTSKPATLIEDDQKEEE